MLSVQIYICLEESDLEKKVEEESGLEEARDNLRVAENKNCWYRPQNTHHILHILYHSIPLMRARVRFWAICSEVESR